MKDCAGVLVEIGGQLVQGDAGATSAVDVAGRGLDHGLAVGEREVEAQLAQLPVQLGRRDDALLDKIGVSAVKCARRAVRTSPVASKYSNASFRSPDCCVALAS